MKKLSWHCLKRSRGQIMNYKDRAIRLKHQGLTIEEVLAVLKQEGYTKPNGQALIRYHVAKVVKGICPQRGYRKPGVYDLTPEERTKHDQAMAERQRERMKKWKRDNIERFKAYQEHYYRAYMKKQDKKLKPKFGYDIQDNTYIKNKAEQDIINLLKSINETSSEEHDLDDAVIFLNDVYLAGKLKFTKKMASKLRTVRKGSLSNKYIFTKRTVFEICGYIANITADGRIVATWE